VNVSPKIKLNNIDEENNLKLFQFPEITGLKDKNESRKISESTNWNLDQAVDKYFQNKNETNQTSGNILLIYTYIK
jgi:hypothetical protein